MRSIPVVLFAMFITLSNFSCTSMDTNEFDNHYAHVVYFWFHNPDNAEDRKLFENSLQRFLKNSKYAKTNFIGVAPSATREVVDDSYTYNLILSFESAAAQEAYQNEMVHQLFIEESKHLWKRVVVYDAIPIKN